jgi:hypothetical protein
MQAVQESNVVALHSHVEMEGLKAQIQAMQLEGQLQVQQLRERASLLENTVLTAKHKIRVLETQVEFVPYPSWLGY